MLVKNYFITTFVFLIGLLLANITQAKLVEYEFDIDEKIVNFTGAKVQALTVGGGIPAPLIEGEVGDVLKVTFNNKMDVETSIHWHGVLLPNDQDGVPYLTTQPIKPKTSFTYQFPITHHGTYWYHSHTGLQEQKGVYGPIVFRKRNQIRNKKMDQVLVLSDWTDEDPKTIFRNLKRNEHYYAMTKGSVVSLAGAMKQGKGAVSNFFAQQFSRMGAMDVSDVGNYIFLVNGKKQINYSAPNKGKKYKFRVINAAASSYFYLEYSGGNMTIVAADGVDVKPLDVKRLKIAIGETYDVLVNVPDEQGYEIRASSIDGTGYSSVFLLGDKQMVKAHTIPKPNLYMTDHSNMKHDKMKHGNMKHRKNKSKNRIEHSEKQHDKMKHGTKPQGMIQQKKIAQQGKVEYQKQSKKKNNKTIKTKLTKAQKKQKIIQKQMTLNKEQLGKIYYVGGQLNKSYKLNEDWTKITPMINKNDWKKGIMNDYSKLRAVKDTSYNSSAPIRNVLLTLTGAMRGYVWSFNNKVLTQSDKILIKKGEVVRFKLENKTMMSHPLHLHGHFFRVLNGQGKYSPLKHTVNVPAMQTVVIEFEADKEKDWFFHCHNLYHMKAGMSQIVSYYKTTKADKNVMEKLFEDKIYTSSTIRLQTNRQIVELSAFNTYNKFNVQVGNYIVNRRFNYEVETDYERIITRYLSLYGGGRITSDYRAIYHIEEGPKRKRFTEIEALFGMKYLLPMMINFDLSVTHKLKVKAEAEYELQLTDRIELELAGEVNYDFRSKQKKKLDYEYRANLLYYFTPDVAAIIGYDSENAKLIGVKGLTVGMKLSF